MPATGSRAGVVDGATWTQLHTLLASGGVSPDGITSTTTLSATVTVSAAQLFNLATTSRELIPAPASGRLLPVSMEASRSGGTGIDHTSQTWQAASNSLGLVMDLATSSPDSVVTYSGYGPEGLWVIDLPGSKWPGRYRGAGLLADDPAYWSIYSPAGDTFLRDGGLYLYPVAYHASRVPTSSEAAGWWAAAMTDAGGAELAITIRYRIVQ